MAAKQVIQGLPSQIRTDLQICLEVFEDNPKFEIPLCFRFVYKVRFPTSATHHLKDLNLRHSIPSTSDNSNLEPTIQNQFPLLLSYPYPSRED